MYNLPLLEENSFLPDFAAVPAEVLRRTKLLWLNYPNNPTGAVAGREFFERAVAWAREHQILICHDAAYSEIAFDGFRPPVFWRWMGPRMWPLPHCLNQLHRT